MPGKVLINLTTGMEDGEKVTVAFLVAGAALGRGSEVAIFLTQEAVRLAVPGTAEGTFCEGCPPLERIFEQVAEGGGELLGVPVLRQLARARRRGFRRPRPRRGRHADARMARRRAGDGLQLLTSGRGTDARRSRPGGACRCKWCVWLAPRS